MKHIILTFLSLAAIALSQPTTPGTPVSSGVSGNGSGITNPTAFAGAIGSHTISPGEAILWDTDQHATRSNLGAQATLVSGTNIKTINSESLLGSGNITISGGDSGVISPSGLVSDGRRLDTAAISSGSTTLTASGASFQVGDVGKFIRVIGAGTAGADLITTIAARVSTTQLTLAAAASTTVSGATMFYGTDNTAAMNNAVNAAFASTTTKTVRIPAGIYLCNITIREGVILEGISSRMNQAVLPGGAAIVSDYSSYTVLMPALGTLPVIGGDGSSSATSVGGTVIRRLIIFGTPGKTGHGIRLGEDSGATAFFAGLCIKVEQVWVSGFKYAFAASRVADIHFELCQASTSTYGWNMAEVDTVETLRYTDGVVITACTSVGVETVFRFQGSKNVVINGGDYNSTGSTNDMLRLVRMLNSKVTITTANVEAPGSDVIEKTNGRLVVNTIKVLSGLKGLVADLGNTSFTTVDSAELSLEGWGASNAVPVVWKGVANNPYPAHLPKGMALQWFSSTALTTLVNAELTSLRYGPQMDLANFTDFFTRGTTAAPFGALGWSSTAISGSFAGRVDSASNTFEWYTTGGAGANQAGRFSFEREFLALNENFEVRFVLQDGQATSGASICRIGCYSHDASITPVDGVGFRVDRSASTNIFFEVINNGSITSVDMGVAASSNMTSLREYIIRKTPQGIYGVIRNNPASGTDVIAAMQRNSGTLRSENAAPALYWGTTATPGYVSARIREFSFRRLATNSFN